MLRDKKIIIGISGGIAAYKIPLLIRLLVKEGAQVKIIATNNALEFVTLTTLRTLSNNSVYHQLFPKEIDYSTEHISISDWGDLFVLAPATANIIGKYANGIADDALSTTLLAFNKDVFIAPAMNTKMYNNPAVKANISKLKSFGANFISPTLGNLACGYDGEGRMEDVENIFSRIREYFQKDLPLKGKTVLVTAGPTYEQIDAVRFIGNYSSGKMGFCLAEEIAKQGGKVILIAGPVSLTTQNKDITRIDVKSAEEMYLEANKYFPDADVAILSAAVADYKPKQEFKNKLKKTQSSLNIELCPTKDILKSLGEKKKDGQILIGFALETDNEIENAKKKLNTKNLDFIVLNSLNDKGAGFGTPTNKVTIIDKDEILSLSLKSKEEVAQDIVKKLVTFL